MDGKSQVAGRVQVGAGSEIIESVVCGPVVIGENCTIKKSFIGPFIAVGTGTVLEEVKAVQDPISSQPKSPRITNTLSAR